mmetsp:Transcript_18111/g.38975  ORF Transcript_18111/g.38975 Transcript_18111/m.38975 type:complete len:346 (+) Transcript_18111:168-1205(+)
MAGSLSYWHPSPRCNLIAKPELLGTSCHLIVVIVYRAAVLGGINAPGLLLLGDAQLTQGLENGEEDAHEGADPGGDDEDADNLAGQQAAATPLVESTVVGRPSIGLHHILLLGHEAHEDDAPHAAESVHGRGQQGVINAQLEEEDAHALKDQGGHERVDDRGPGLQHVRAGGDGHEAYQHAVAGVDHVPGLVPQEGDAQHGHPASTARQGGAHSSAGSHSRGGLVVNDEGGAGVEAVPSKPQQYSAQYDQYSAVAGHVHGLALRVKSAHAGADHDAAHEAGQAAHHVDHCGSGKVNHTRLEQEVAGVTANRGVRQVGGEGEPSLTAPHPVDHHGVHEAREEDGVA